MWVKPLKLLPLSIYRNLVKKILARNWRNRFCEIDIVCTKSETVYFIEVKYRSSSAQGDGMHYITKQKLRQMRFAAASWCHAHAWQAQQELLAVSVSGPNFEHFELIEITDEA